VNFSGSCRGTADAAGDLARAEPAAGERARSEQRREREPAQPPPAGEHGRDEQRSDRLLHSHGRLEDAEVALARSGRRELDGQQRFGCRVLNLRAGQRAERDDKQHDRDGGGRSRGEGEGAAREHEGDGGGAIAAGDPAARGDVPRGPHLEEHDEDGVECEEQPRQRDRRIGAREDPQRHRDEQEAVVQRHDHVQQRQAQVRAIADDLPVAGRAACQALGRPDRRQLRNEQPRHDVRGGVRREQHHERSLAVREQCERGEQAAGAVTEVAQRVLPRERDDLVRTRRHAKHEHGCRGPLHAAGELDHDRNGKERGERTDKDVRGKPHGARREAPEHDPPCVEPAEQRP
jgi:hypothetical protein